MARKRAARRYFGSVRELPSGRFQARYTGPDGQTYRAQRADGGALTFDARGDAEAWLSLRQSEILRKEWMPPTAAKVAPTKIREYAEAWLATRELEDRTREHYAQLLRDHVYPKLGDVPVKSLEPDRVRAWHAELKETTGPTARSHAYSLLRTVMNSARDEDELITANPCRVRGAGQSKRARKIRPASLGELQTIVTSVPDFYRLFVLLAAWCALRFGEIAEIRRSDVDTKNGVLHVRRGVVRTSSGKKVKDPKSEAGKRPVAIPPHLLPVIKAHLAAHAAMGRDGLLFPSSRNGDQLAPSSLYRVYYPARAKAGREDLRFHDLRHTGAVLAASTGATLAELMARLGHATAGAAMRYQHAAQDRDKVIAGALSQLVAGDLVPLETAASKSSARGRRAVGAQST